MKVSIFNRLEALRDIKTNELNHWLKERILDIRTIASDYEVRILEKINENEKDNQRDVAIISRARAFLKRYLQNSDDFYEIFIINPYTKKILISSDEKNDGKTLLRDSHFEGAL
jgi:predicted oxidoreductase